MKTDLDYTLWKNFNNLLLFDDKACEAFQQTTKLTKELSSVIKSYGNALKKIKEKFSPKKESFSKIPVTNEAHLALVELVGKLSDENDKLSSQLGESENLMKVSLNGQKEAHKRISKRYDSAMSDWNKAESQAKTGNDKYSHAVTAGRKAYAVMKDTENDKTNTVLDIERSKEAFVERSAACDKIKEECHSLIDKYNEVTNSTIKDIFDKIIKDLSSQMSNRITTEGAMIKNIHNLINAQLNLCISHVKGGDHVLNTVDPDNTIGLLQKTFAQNPFTMPATMIFDDLGQLECAKPKNKKKPFFKVKAQSSIDLANRLRNDIKSIGGMREMLHVFEANPTMGDSKAVKAKINQTIKNFSLGMKQLEKGDITLYNELVVQSSAFYVEDNESLLSHNESEWNEEFSNIEVKFGVIIEDFSMDEVGTLKVRKDEKVEILYTDESGWVYVARCAGDQDQGHVPLSYIKMLD